MRTPVSRTIVSVLLCAITASAAFAHHSFTMVDRDRAKLIVGTVTEWHYNSPHVWLYIEAPDANGELIRWGVEGAAPVRVITQGVKGDTFTPGEQLRIVMSPLRDGRPAGGVCFAEKADGQILFFNDGSCFAQNVLEQWQKNGWLANGTHLEEHVIE